MNNKPNPTFVSGPSSLASCLSSVENSEATEGEAWFWIAITVSCVPWLAILVAWLI